MALHNNASMFPGSNDDDPSYADALADADPTSPQGLPSASGAGSVGIGTADMVANLEASSAVYWLEAFVKKHQQFDAELQPTIERLKQLAIQVEMGGTGAPGQPPAPPPPGGMQPGLGAPGAPLGGMQPPPPRPGVPPTGPAGPLAAALGAPPR